MKKSYYTLLRSVRNRHVFVFDLIMLSCIPAIALSLRTESFEDARKYLLPLILYTSLSILWKVSVFYFSGMYNRYWRYASVEELSTVLLANVIAAVIGIGIFLGVLKPLGIMPEGFPRSIPIIDALLTSVLVGGFRFVLRMGADYHVAETGTSKKKKRALIVGAGFAGSMILKELKMNPQLRIEPIGFLDDDLTKKNVRIHGVPVIGVLYDLPEVIRKFDVAEVIIAMPTAPGRAIRDIVQMCKQVKVPSKTIPGIFEILGGSAKVSQIRDIQIEDLLRRGVVNSDPESIANLVRGARVMVTGAGGSIGSELCRQIRGFEPEELVLVGHGENSIFAIAKELSGQSSLPAVRKVIADVRDRERMRHVFQIHRPTVVFHAAAHKHVGLMEENIPDAVTNNVLGTKVLVDLADQFGVERFVMISSDKAVNPTCIMGVTKRVAELIVHDAAERTRKHFVSVRFGNVLGSRGSVVPIFKQQIAQGGPVCITHPEVKRYFMTIPEAVQLVLQAATMGEGGEVFVLDMGEPIKIVDLARDLIRLSGLEEERDIDIVYTGLQPGEKMSEELFFQAEKVERSNHEKIFVCRNGFESAKDYLKTVARARSNFNADVWREPSLAPELERLLAAAQNGASKNVQALLKQIVPEYVTMDDIDITPLSEDIRAAMSFVEERTSK